MLISKKTAFKTERAHGYHSLIIYPKLTTLDLRLTEDNHENIRYQPKSIGLHGIATN